MNNGDKIVCINNKRIGISNTVSYLTLNKVYTVHINKRFNMILIEDDDGDDFYIDEEESKRFKPLSELREEKINNLLK